MHFELISDYNLENILEKKEIIPIIITIDKSEKMIRKESYLGRQLEIGDRMYYAFFEKADHPLEDEHLIELGAMVDAEFPYIEKNYVLSDDGNDLLTFFRNK